MKLFTHNLTDSVELFDGSSADNTGHVLAGLGAHGLTAGHSRSVRRAVRFLRRTQDPVTGLWEGRWGINTLYGTTQAGTGLLRAGESPQSPYLLRAAYPISMMAIGAGGQAPRPKARGCLSFSVKWGFEMPIPFPRP